MIFLFTDYGLEGPYIGQIEMVIHQRIPDEKVINLVADAPRNNPKASAYLLASLMSFIPSRSILFCVVDPGVGSYTDKSVILEVDNRWLVGPDNGIFDMVMRHSGERKCWEIKWQPEKISDSFHGRDLYAPICALIAENQTVPNDHVVAEQMHWQDKHDWPDDLNEIIYIDHFGNCMTGIRSESLSKHAVLRINRENIHSATTFSSVGKGNMFWYGNSNNLVEIAVNQGSAKEKLCLKIGDKITV